MEASQKEPQGGEEGALLGSRLGKLDVGILEGFDSIIHLGGEGIGDKRWSKKRKSAIRNSRVDSTPCFLKP
ncbi:MAG: hypothetical protein Ct9H90mP21_1170 [Methanobacteriota archaeon]|nr:MAG: hypothetical protein Ct9H90mP21_1170 [Euryarchaeota archaeon]